MDIEIFGLGGYSEVGMNMTAIRVGDDVIICDMGFYLPEVIRLQDEDVVKTKLSREDFIQHHIIPDDSVLEGLRGNVKAIILPHCHLDHIGAVPLLAKRYNCPIYGAPYTLEVLKSILLDEDVHIPNKLNVLQDGDRVKISENITLEFMEIPHSTPQTMMAIIHTPKGIVLYGNDFKLDNDPTLGRKTNYKRLREIGAQGIKVFIVDSLYAYEEVKTPSERLAREMLKDVLLSTENKGKLVIVTTFASHIARLQATIEFARTMGRKGVILGRSMDRYISAAENIRMVNFSKRASIARYTREVRKMLTEVQKNPGKYVVICTGHQGEPRSILMRMVTGELPYKFSAGDQVIFACKTIPVPINIANRAALETKLKQKGVRLFKDIHASGHLAREDHHDLIKLLHPQHIIPCQGDVSKLMPLAELAEELGYKYGKTVHVMRNGQSVLLE